MSDDNMNIDKISEMSYKIDLEIANTFENKRKIEEVNNQESEVISEVVDRAEEILTQSSAQKILQSKLELDSINITGICHQK